MHHDIHRHRLQRNDFSRPVEAGQERLGTALTRQEIGKDPHALWDRLDVEKVVLANQKRQVVKVLA